MNTTRRYASLGLSLVALTLAGCGGSNRPALGVGSETVFTAPEAATTSSTTHTTTTAAPSNPSHYVGTISQSDGEGTAFNVQYRIGKPVAGSASRPPQAVLTACDYTYSPWIASAVFVPGQVTISYTEGSLPITLFIASAAFAMDETPDQSAEVAFDLEGDWHCPADEEGENLSFEFQPGQSRTMMMWLLWAEILSNAHPRLSGSETNGWEFQPIGVNPGGNALPHITARGPGAATCYGEPLLMLYDRPPDKICAHKRPAEW